MDFLGKGRVLWFQSLFREFTLTYKIRIRLLSRVYHFSLLICYPYSSVKLKLISTFHLPALSHSISFCLTISLALSHSPSIIFSPILSPIPSHPFFLANPLFLSYFLCLPLFFSLLLSSTSSFLVNLSFSCPLYL